MILCKKCHRVLYSQISVTLFSYKNALFSFNILSKIIHLPVLASYCKVAKHENIMIFLYFIRFLVYFHNNIAFFKANE